MLRAARHVQGQPVKVGEQLGNKLAAAADADLGEDSLQVVAHGLR